MIKTNLPLLFIKNHEIFPFTETKLEFSDINFKQTISLAESCFDNCLFIIHQKQTDNLEAKNNINIGRDRVRSEKCFYFCAFICDKLCF